MVFGKIRQKLNSKSSSEGTPWQRATAESERQKKAQIKQKITINGRLHRLLEEKKAKLKPRKTPFRNRENRQTTRVPWLVQHFLDWGHRQQFSDFPLR